MRHLDPCHCGGTMKRYATKTLGRVRTRYLKCDRCEATDQEVFYVDDRGRPLYASTFTRRINGTLHLHRHPLASK